MFVRLKSVLTYPDPADAPLPHLEKHHVLQCHGSGLGVNLHPVSLGPRSSPGALPRRTKQARTTKQSEPGQSLHPASHPRATSSTSLGISLAEYAQKLDRLSRCRRAVELHHNPAGQSILASIGCSTGIQVMERFHPIFALRKHKPVVSAHERRG